jgi:pimeloyl-ACP methyl ester carboxylesterase
MHDHYLDLGGEPRAPLLLLGPANGIPPEAYRPLGAALAPRLRALGYRPRPLWPHPGPPTPRAWRLLAADMLADIAALGAGPVIAAGHSLGGILSAYCALQRPELFRGVALIEPTLMPRPLLPLLWAARRTGLHHRYPIARRAARRRDRFASVEEARERYRGRGIFAGFTAEALEGYLEGGLRPDPAGGVRLAWPREWESHIFAHLPVDTWDAVARLRLPLLVVRAAGSDLLVAQSWAELKRRLPHARLIELEGGHMVPMERPGAVAEAILGWAETLPA